MIINTWNIGQLCNRLLTSADIMGFCIEHQIPYLNLGLSSYKNLFPRLKNNPFCQLDISHEPSNKRVFSFTKGHHFALKTFKALGKLPFRRQLSFQTNSDIFDINSRYSSYYLDTYEKLQTLISNNIIITNHGWPRCKNNLKLKHRSIINRELSFNSDHYTLVSRFISKKIPKNNKLLGIHIRRGDYIDFENGRYFWDIRDYISFIRQISFENVCFVICSNENISESEFSDINAIVSPFSSAVEDLILLSHCNLIIGPPSTFSYWAGYMGNSPTLKLESLDKKSLNLVKNKICNLEIPSGLPE